MKVSVSVIKNEIREQSCRYYHVDVVCGSFFFALGHWNEFLGFVPDYYTKSIGKKTKVSLSVMARVYGLISC